METHINHTNQNDDYHGIHKNDIQESTSDDWGNLMGKKVIDGNMLIPLHNIFLHKIEDKQKIIDLVDIEDMASIDIKIISNLNLLEKASTIAKNLKFQFNKRFDDDKENFMKWMIRSLEWLRDAMHELSDRKQQYDAFRLRYSGNPVFESLELSELTELSKSQTDTQNCNSPSLLKKKPQNIYRNSYKFCEFRHLCRFNYNKEQKCYAHHYVYELVYMDISDILKYANNIDQNMMEIIKSINTITYVINHMSEELNQLKITNTQYYTEYENRSYPHVNKKQINKIILSNSE